MRQDDLSAARNQLAKRLTRDLPHDDEETAGRTALTLPPQLVADVLATVQIESPRSEARVRRLLEEAGSEGGAWFDELIDSKLLRLSGGQVHWSRALPFAVKQGYGDQRLLTLFALPHQPKVTVTDEAARHLRSSTAAVALALANAKNPEDRLDRLRAFASCAIAPGWVSARLWEQRPKCASGVWWWYERNVLLQNACSAPDGHWNRNLASSLIEAILEAIEGEPDLYGWTEERQRILVALGEGGGLADERVRADWAPVPEDFFGRLDWIANMGRHAQGPLTSSRESMLALIGICLRALKYAPEHDAPHPQVQRLLELARERPAVFTGIDWYLREHPEAIADMLLDRDFSFWAVLCLADWRVQSTHNQEEIRDQEIERVMSCFRASLRESIDTWLADPAGAGPGLAWLLKSLRQLGDEDVTASRSSPLRAQLWMALADGARRSEAELAALVDAAAENIAQRVPPDGLNGPWFRATLELVREAGFRLSSARRAEVREALVSTYLSFFGTEDVTGHEPLVPRLAATLVREMLLSPRTRDTFQDLNWLRSVIQRVERDHASIYSVREQVRTHIRLIARAIQGWGGDAIPSEVVKAFEGALTLGTSERPSHGLVNAFAMTNEVRDGTDTLAADVARAVNALGVEQRKVVVEILCRLDEPMALAILSRTLRGESRARLQSAAAIATRQAPGFDSRSDAWASTQALLDAELYDEAAAMLSEESSLRRLGKSANLRWRFVAELRLALGQKNYDKVLATEIPDGLRELGDADPRHTLDFYQGLAEMDRPKGSLEAAEQRFQGLVDRFPDVRAYAENLHAVRIRRVLEPDASWPVGPEKRDAVAALFVEGEALMDRFSSRKRVSDVYAGNRAMLLMALGEYERVLADLGADDALLWNSDRLLGMRIRALAKLGRTDEAGGLLDHATAEFGETESLLAARSELHGGTKPPRPGVHREAIDIRALRSAFAELARCAPEDQAAVVNARSSRQFITSLVEMKCATVSQLVPFLSLKTPRRRREQQNAVETAQDPEAKAKPWEEGINKLLTQLVEAAVEYLGWSLHPEDPGGPTTGRKWGSRDFAIKKGPLYLATSEAQIVKETGSNGSDIRAHIEQLRRKSTCDLGLHILWSFSDDPGAVLQHVRRVVEGMRSVGPHSSLHDGDGSTVKTGPLAFVSVWRERSGRPLYIVHLIVDMKQHAQKRDQSRPVSLLQPSSDRWGTCKPSRRFR